MHVKKIKQRNVETTSIILVYGDCLAPKVSRAGSDVAYLLLVQLVRGLLPGEIKNFLMKILNLEVRRGGDVQLLIPRLYINGLDLIPNLPAERMLRRNILLSIAIPLDMDVMPGGYAYIHPNLTCLST